MTNEDRKQALELIRQIKSDMLNRGLYEVRVTKNTIDGIEAALSQEPVEPTIPRLIERIGGMRIKFHPMQNAFSDQCIKGDAYNAALDEVIRMLEE